MTAWGRAHELARRSGETVPPSPAEQPVAVPHQLLALQRSAGNQAVTAMLSRMDDGKSEEAPGWGEWLSGWVTSLAGLVGPVRAQPADAVPALVADERMEEPVAP